MSIESRRNATQIFLSYILYTLLPTNHVRYTPNKQSTVMLPTNTVTTTPSSTLPPSGNTSQENIELQPIRTAVIHDPGRLSSDEFSKNADPAEFLPQPSTTVSVAERWNHPRSNICRTGATMFAFMIAGANDGAYGVGSPLACDVESC
jgi:hypothetical protein